LAAGGVNGSPVTGRAGNGSCRLRCDRRRRSANSSLTELGGASRLLARPGSISLVLDGSSSQHS